MITAQLKTYLTTLLKNSPKDWLNLTTHRLDIYNESRAKSEFLEALEHLYTKNNTETATLAALPTAYDYIRLGHPLSCVLEWAISKNQQQPATHVVSFASQTMALMAVLRHNYLEGKQTRILYKDQLPSFFDTDLVSKVYQYNIELVKVNPGTALPPFEGTTVSITHTEDISAFNQHPQADILINTNPNLGSILVIKNTAYSTYVNTIQHVRRRESIAMTPSNCLNTLHNMVGAPKPIKTLNTTKNKAFVIKQIQDITNSPTKVIFGSSGLSVQYAIMMGLIDDAQQKHPKKDIKFIVPTNCYGGTNDQARRVAACLPQVHIVDLQVDGVNDMVTGLEHILQSIAYEDAVPYIIAEIPTNPRVEVPNLEALQATLAKKRTTKDANEAIEPVFVLDQTFCPNVHFLGADEILSKVKALSYASGSKFPSGGKCTAGYCVGNTLTNNLMHTIEQHLLLCDNEATDLQYHYLAEQLPSMNQRIASAYANTKAFVNFIKQELPAAKINFVSPELAKRGFTPSVFSLDLPTKGSTYEEREQYKRALNHKLINMMITQIPNQSKYCVSYGQLKGCYWTIPATSTQGTTKEGDKDYIARVALSSIMELEKHKAVFADFVKQL